MSVISKTVTSITGVLEGMNVDVYLANAQSLVSLTKPTELAISSVIAVTTKGVSDKTGKPWEGDSIIVVTRDNKAYFTSSKKFIEVVTMNGEATYTVCAKTFVGRDGWDVTYPEILNITE